MQNGVLHGTSELERAALDVKNAERALAHRVHEATALGEEKIKHAVAAARPVLIGVAVLAGLVVVASLLRRSSRSRGMLGRSPERSVLAEATRAAALALASVAARRLAERFLVAQPVPQLSPAGRTDPPQAPARPAHSR